MFKKFKSWYEWRQRIYARMFSWINIKVLVVFRFFLGLFCLGIVPDELSQDPIDYFNLVLFLFLGIGFLVGELPNLKMIILNKKVENPTKKTDYLQKQYKHLIKSVCETQKKKIIDLNIEKPDLPSLNWSIYTVTLGDNKESEYVEIDSISDSELNELIK